jgi:nicotinamidase/pyrazinamidase
MSLVVEKTLLLEVDVQNDFCPAHTSATGEKHPDGAMAVWDGGGVVVPLNSLAVALAAAGGWVAATQDWHPAGHVSFASAHPDKRQGDVVDLSTTIGQILWADHCIQGRWGAAFHSDLDLRPVSLIIRKEKKKNLDSYSAFFENDRKTSTGLGGWIRGLGIQTVIIGGLATDYCVFYSAMDSKTMGVDTMVVSDAVREVGYPPGFVGKAMAEMQNAGIAFVDSKELLEELGK